MKPDSVCLAMLVGDDASHLEASLDSVLPLVSSYVLVDTGSRDSMVDRARSLLSDIPGEMIQFPLCGVSFMRRRLLAEAGNYGSHALFLDADERVQVIPGKDWSSLPDVGMIQVRSPDHFERQARLVSTSRGLEIQGSVFETLECDPNLSVDTIDQFVIEHSGQGFRSGTGTVEDDHLRLMADLNLLGESESRYLHLGLIQQQTNDPDHAEYYFLKCLELAASRGNQELRWRAGYELGRMLVQSGRLDEAGEVLAEAYDLFPGRMEPLYPLIRASCLRQDWETATALLGVAQGIGMNNDAAWCEWPLYDSLTERLVEEFPELDRLSSEPR